MSNQSVTVNTIVIRAFNDQSFVLTPERMLMMVDGVHIKDIMADFIEVIAGGTIVTVPDIAECAAVLWQKISGSRCANRLDSSTDKKVS